MKELEDLTLKEATDYIISEISIDREISKSLARKLFINALTYNVVISAIDDQIDYIIEN